MQRNSSAHAPPKELIDFACLLRSIGLTAVLLPLAGCSLPAVARHAVAFNAATRVVIDSSEDAYSAANRLHREVMVSKAVADYDKNASWSPYNDVKPLLTTDQLDARLKILDGLKAYSETLVHLTHPRKNKALEGAAAGIGSNVKALDGTITKNFGGTVLSETAANVVSTAVDALGEFLIARTTEKGLKQVTATMDPHVVILCELLRSDVAVLRRQADVDYQTLITDEDQLIRHATVDPFTHREQVGRLIALAGESKANDELLGKLAHAVHTLGTAHQALTAAAQGKDAETVRQRITELSAAGESLATFYKSLSSSSSSKGSAESSSGE